MLRFLRIALGSLVCLGLANSASFAQSVQGSITGTVKDPLGAIVVAAKVTATDVATNVQHSTATNGSGLYSFPDLFPGTYVVTVSAPGFKELKSSNIILVAAAMKRFDAKLEVGAATTEVMVVKATPPTLITDSAEVGNVVVGEDIIREPIQRSIFQLEGLSAGNVENGSRFSIGGQRTPFQNSTIDGITTMNNNFGDSSGAMTGAQSFESIAEVKVIQGNGSAEQPGFAGLITTTKSGTNQLHGSAFYTSDNAAFNALGFGTQPPGPKGPELQWYGGSLGGPVWIPKVYKGRNKTFFFVTWEHRTFPLAAGNAFVATGNLPTLAFRGQTNPNGDADFSSLLPGTQLVDPFNGNAPFTGNIIPRARLSSVALALQNNYYPAPNRGNPTDYIGNFQFLAKSPEHLDREDIRIDHHFSDRDSISGRFTYQDDPQPFNYDTNTPIFYHSRGTNVTNTYISETHSFTSVMVNEFRVGYSRDRRFFNPSHDGNAVLQQIGLNLAVPVQAGTKGFPNIGFTPTNSNGGVDGFFERGSSIELAQEYSLLDNVTWQKGTHTIEVGIQVRNGRPQNSAGNFADQFGQFTFTGFATGFPYADFLLGVPFSELQNTDIPNVYIRKTDTGLFAQDSWHATSKLTLNYGLRWEYYKPPTDINDRRVNFDPATGNIVVAKQKTLSLLNPTLPTVLVNNVEVGKYPGGRSLLSGRKTNFGPRLGFAYLLPKGTVVRGGYGIYFGPLTQAVQDSLENSGLFGTYLAAPQNSFTNNVPAFQFPSPFAAITTGGGSTCTTGCGIVVAGTDPHLKTPTAQEWNFTVERDLGRSMVARVGYRGFMLTQLPVIDNLIIPPVPSDPQLYPFYGGVNWTHDGAIQKMNALDLTLERKFTHGLTFGFSYTLTKNTSDVTDGESGSASNPYNRAADMGNVWYVPRHRLVNNLVWDIPIGRGQRFASGIPRGLDYVVGGWETTIINVFQSGDLLTPVWNGDGSIISNEGVSLRPNCNGSLSSPHKSRQEWFNTAAFSAPAPGTYGNCGVGIIEGPGLIGFSFGLHKAFKLSEKVSFKLEANMMNAFNHPNPADPDVNYSDLGNGFGAIAPTSYQGGGNLFNPGATSNNGERHIWLGLRLEF